MIKNLFTCCNCTDLPKINDLKLSEEKDFPKINIYNDKKKVTTLINTIPVQLKLILTSKSNSLLLYKRKIKKDKSLNHLYNILNLEKISNNQTISLPPFFNYHKSKDSKIKNLSLIKMNNSLLSNILNISNAKNSISEIKDLDRTKLILSGDLFFGKNIRMTPNGIDNNFLKRNERTTFFGIKNLYDLNGKPYNDYLINYAKKRKNDKNDDDKNIIVNPEKINEEKKYVDEDNSTRVFKIIYDKESDEYKFIYLEHSLFLYYLIKNKLILEKNKKYYIILDEVFLYILIKKEINKKPKICMKVENGNDTKKYLFYTEDTPIKIGRKNCNININLISLSKFHCFIDYSINDGNFFFQDNCSKNGSVLLLKEDDTIPIKGKMNFKLENTFFQIEEEK